MKKIYFTILLLGICVISFPQPEKGKLFIGGNIGFNVNTNDTKTDTSSTRNITARSLTILPMAGYFLSEKFAVGIRGGINMRTVETPAEVIYKNMRSMVVINPFGRYYIWKYGSGNGLFSVAGAVGLFTDVSLYTAFGRERNYTDPDIFSQKIQNFSFGVSPGIFYYLTNKFSFEAKFGWLGFESEMIDYGDKKDITNNYGINLSPESFMLGMNFRF